ncbi:MAG: hypothetical protein QOH14_477, partial [Pseudonocardiales bacterium]|nr:hypothetical protein [Pseudonocardiales bacterium]
MRAREPDRCGYAVRSGVRLYYEVAGSGPTTILPLPADRPVAALLAAQVSCPSLVIHGDRGGIVG